MSSGKQDIIPSQPSSTASLLHPIQPSSLDFARQNLNNAELVHLTLQAIQPRLPEYVRVLLYISTIECSLCFSICAVLLLRKKNAGKLWIFTIRHSPYGRFIVPNSLFSIVLGVAIYLLGWLILIPNIIAVSYKKAVSEFICIWVVPFPWMPLVISCYYSVYGFMLSCSPRSPLSNVRAYRNRFHLPVCHRAWLMNTVLVVIPIVFFGVNLWLTISAGRQFINADRLRHTILPDSTLQALLDDNPDQLASVDLVWTCKRVWAAHAEIWRYSTISLFLYALLAFFVTLGLFIYCVPNTITLIHYVYDSCPQRPLKKSSNFFAHIRFLLNHGRPKFGKQGATRDFYYETTWKMALLCLVHIAILVIVVPLFSAIPIFMVAAGWPQGMLKGDLGPYVFASAGFCSLVTIGSCIYTVIFCTFLSFDPLFRAVMGLNFVRAPKPTFENDSGGHLVPENALDLESRDIACNSKLNTTADTDQLPVRPASPIVLNNPSFKIVRDLVISIEDVDTGRITSKHNYSPESFLDLKN